jgi:hypothetical protein
MGLENYKTQFAEHSELGAKLRKQLTVPRQYTLAALDMIDRGEVACDRFISGMPDLKRVHSLAVQLYTRDYIQH